jgi:peptide/nickel transport system permease protein
MTDATVAPPKQESQRGAIWRQFRTHKGALFGLIVLSALIIFVVVGPLVWVPEKLSVAEAIKLKNQGPSWRFPFGTDQLGRDMFARMMLAGRISLAVGFVAMAIAISVGTLVGVLAGYFKRLDGPLMRLTDMFLALPVIPLLLVMVMLFRDRMASIIGPELGAFVLIVFAIGITSWMQTARIVRGEVLALKEREYVLAARSIGAKPFRIILRHILPNVVSAVMVAATLEIAGAIITESVLSFLGLGFPPDFPTWGRLLFDGLQYMQVYPERVIWPGLAISLTVLSVNYIGDGLRDALDPRIRGR